jgi:membrane protein implicated in regulation of membrane protease activity
VGDIAAHALRHPIVAIFVTAGVFEVLAHDVLWHAVFLFVMAAALVWERMHRRVREHREAKTSRRRVIAPPPRRIGIAVMGAAAAYAAAVGGFASYSWPMTIAVGLPIAVALLFVWRDRRSVPTADPPRLDVKRAALWGGLFVALMLVELASVLMQPSLGASSYTHPTMTHLLAPILSHNPLDRSLALFLWMGLGWILVRT